MVLGVEAGKVKSVVNLYVSLIASLASCLGLGFQDEK